MCPVCTRRSSSPMASKLHGPAWRFSLLAWRGAQSLEWALKFSSRSFQAGMEGLTQQQYSFGPFVVDPVEKVLLRNGQLVPLAPKVFEILLALVEAHGHVLEKAALLKRVWPDTFVEEATLAQDVFTLRKVLGDAAEGRGDIATAPH